MILFLKTTGLQGEISLQSGRDYRSCEQHLTSLNSACHAIYPLVARALQLGWVCSE